MIILSKKLCFIVVSVLLTVGILANLVGVANSVVASPMREYCVVIDAGHGGIDGGTVGVDSGVSESDLNLLVANELRDYMENNFYVTMTRTTRDGLYGDTSAGFKRRDMTRRREIISEARADVVISIHMNRFASSTRRGAQACYQKGDEKSRALAVRVQRLLDDHLNIPILGRGFEPIAGEYYILKSSDSPGVIVECGFLSSPLDDALMNTVEHRRRIAYIIYSATVSYLADNNDEKYN